MRATRWLPPAVGAAVLVTVLAVVFLPSGGPASAGTGPAGLPTRFANYSYLTGDVSDSPPGRALAIYQHGYGVETFDFPQAVVTGADGDVYRRLDVAEARAGAETQGDPAAMLLSPDGTRVAVGDYATSAPDLAVVDLTTGRVDTRPVPGGRSAIPVAWSPDSGRVAYLSTADPVSPYSGVGTSGGVGLLDVGTGTAELLPGDADVRAAAFSPDGSELALHRRFDDGSLSGYDGVPRTGGGTVEVVDLDGTVLRELPLPPHHFLDGPHAWSPDGALLAARVQWLLPCEDLLALGEDEVMRQRCVAERGEGGEDVAAGSTVFIDATGGGGAVPAPVPPELGGRHGVLGWTGPDELLLLDDVPGPGADPELYWVTAVPLDGDEPRPLSAVPGGGNYGIGAFQLATALLPDIEVHEAGRRGEVDRGPWPPWLSLGTALGSGGGALLLTRWVLRRQGV